MTFGHPPSDHDSLPPPPHLPPSLATRDGQRREMGEGRREKGEGRREKGEGRETETDIEQTQGPQLKATDRETDRQTDR